MLNQILEIIKQVIALTRDVQQCKDSIKELRQARADDRAEIKELNDKVRDLSGIVQCMAFDLQRQRENAETDRRMLLLEVENVVLRAARPLSPADQRALNPPNSE